MQKFKTLLAAFCCAALLFSAAESKAVTRTVTSAANSGAGSLRAAVGASADGDIIVFNTLATITLTSQIEISVSLTIQGPNPDELTISGGSSARLFYVNAPGKTVTIAGLRLVNGRSQATPVLNFIAGGGAVFHSAGILVVNECEFEGNVADDGNGSTSFGYGGAIMSQSELHVSNSFFYNNSLNNNNAYGGGAVYVQDDVADHTVSFNNVTFFNNSVTNGNAGADGGALAISENTGSGTDTAPIVELINCTFYNNHSNNDGEEVYIFSNGPDVEITLQNNIFDRAAADGNDISVQCDCVGGITVTSNGGNIYWDTPDPQISTNGTRDQTAQGLNGAGLTGTPALNGGGIRTIAISGDASLADDNGVAGAAVLPRDARDFTREGNPDAGAYEYDGQFTFRSLTPADNAVNVAVNANLVIGFEHNATVNSGNIAIRRVSDDALVRSIDITGAEVSGGGTKTITINPAADLPGNTELYVNWPAAMLTGPQGDDIDALSGATAWSFTTAAAPNSVPTISTSNTIVSGPAAGFLSLYVDILDAETAATSLVLSVASSDVAVVPTSNIVQFVPTNNTTSFRVTCADPNVGGSALITITVKDEGGLSASTTFQVSFIAPQAKFLAFSDQNAGGVDQVNGGNLKITSQQIFSLGFATFSDFTTLKATSASAIASNLDRYGSVTMRILDSPFPSNPNKKPTITGVGGVWSGGPGITSTAAQVRLSSTNAVRAGLIQFGWLGSQATTFTLRIEAGVFAEEGQGSLQATEVTITICPLPADKVSWGLTSAGDNDGFNEFDQSGVNNNLVVRAAANALRESSDISSRLTAYNQIGSPVLVTTATPSTYSFTVNGGSGSLVGSGPTFVPTSLQTTSVIRVRMTEPYARTADLAVNPAGGLQSTNLTMTILTPPARRLAASTVNGIVSGPPDAGLGADGFNGGNLTVPSGEVVPVSISSYDDSNYLTATGNSVWPITPFNNVIAATSENPNVNITIVDPLSLSPSNVTTTGSVLLNNTSSLFQQSIITFTFAGVTGVESTRVRVTVLPGAQHMAFSDQNIGGVDQVNGGNLNIFSQQILTLNFGTFLNAVTLQATSASAYASNVDRYGSATMRIVDSPFPSDPSKKPTITGVGGIWAQGPGVTSTHSEVRLSSTNSVIGGSIQFGWLGSTPTTFTLRLVPGINAEEGLGSLSATEVTLTINPLAPNHLAWSTTNSLGDDGFNPNDISGFGNRFIIQVGANANRESADITADLGTFNIIGGLSPVVQSTPTQYSLSTGFGGSSVISTPPTFQPSSPTVNTSLRLSMRNPVARGANLTLATTDASLSSTTVNITILTPPATQIGLSSTFGSLGGGTGAGIGNEGFNGGNFNLSASTTVNVTLSTYDDANYLTATGNNTFPIVFFTTTAAASVDNPQVSLSGSAQSLTFSPTTATRTGKLNIDYVGSVVTNVTITFSSPGGMTATSVVVTLTPTTPNIIDFTPKFGPVGTEVTITGANLGAITEVLFDGVSSASVTVDSETQIRAIVPNGAATGFITVSGANGSDVSDDEFGVTTSATFAVTDDAYVDSQNPTWNYGLNGSLRARLLNQTRTAYFKFAVGNITTAVVSAKLRVYKATASSSANLLYAVSNSNQNGQPWSEGSLTFNNAPDVSGSPLASSTASAAATWLEFDVASLVSGNGSFSFALQSESDTDVIYRSSESATRPELVIIDADGNDRVFLPTDDSWVNALLPFDNYGNGAAMLSRTLSREFRSYLKFNTGIVQGPVLSATLVLESRVAVSDGGEVFSTSNDLNDNSTPWTNDNIVFNNAPAPGTVMRADIGATTVGGIELLSLAGGVNPGDNTSFVITTPSAETANYYSSNSNGNAPELLVTWLVTNGSAAKSQGSDQVQAQNRGQFGTVDVKLLPNPTEGATSILFETSSGGPVSVGIYDLRGAEVGRIHSGYMTSGPHRIDWNANGQTAAPLSNGVYMIHVATIDGQGVVNLVLQR